MLSYSFKVTLLFRSWCLKCSSMSSNLKPSQKTTFRSQIQEAGDTGVLCLLVLRELHRGILFSFPEIMIWHAGRFLTWPAHKNPPEFTSSPFAWQRRAARLSAELSLDRNSDMVRRTKHEGARCVNEANLH